MYCMYMVAHGAISPDNTFSRELSPVVTPSSWPAASVVHLWLSWARCRFRSKPTQRVLGVDPVDYLVTPRVIACYIALPILTLMCFCIGRASSANLADGVYGVIINIILDLAQRALRPWDIINLMIKSHVFGGIITIASYAWGVTTLRGAKGVGRVNNVGGGHIAREHFYY